METSKMRTDYHNKIINSRDIIEGKQKCKFCGHSLKFNYTVKEYTSYLILAKLKCSGCGIEFSERVIK